MNKKNGSSFDWPLLVLGLSILLLVNINQSSRWSQLLDFFIYDKQLQNLVIPADEKIVIVEIDEQSLSLLGDWPWPRSYHGQMINVLTQADAGIIAYNVIFSNAVGNDKNDQLLASAIKNSGRTILPLYFDRLLKEGDITEVLPAEVFRQHAGLGHVNSYLDDDGTLRSIRLMDRFLDRQWPHFSFASFLFDQPYSTLLEQDLEKVFIPFVTKNDFQRYSFVDVLTGLVPADQFLQRTVFVGVTATSMGDPLLTPVDVDGRQSPAVDINANIYQALSKNQLIHTLSLFIALLINSFVILITFFLLPRLSGLQQLLMTLASLLVLWFISYALLKQGYWYRSAGLMLALLIIPFIWNLLRLSRLFGYFRQQIKELKQQQIKETFHLPVHRSLKDESELHSLLTLIQIENFRLLPVENASRVVGDISDKNQLFSVAKTFIVNIGSKEKTLSIFFDQFTALERRKVSLLHQLLNNDSNVPSLNTESKSVVIDVFSEQLSLIDTFQRQLAVSHSLFEASIESISAGILVSDLTGKVLFSNNALAQLTRENITEVKDLLRVVTLVKRDWLDVLHEVILLQQPITLEASANDKNLSVSVRCIEDQQGLVPVVVINISDITAIKEANRSRNEMIDFLSHDLRSPLASLQAMVNQVREKPLEASAAVTEIIDKVDHYSQRGLNFAEQFLDLAKVEGEEDIQWYEVDLYSVSQNAMDSLYHQAQEKSIKLVLESVDECWVMSNGDLLERIIVNLLSNAIKYSPGQSEVILSITLQETVLDKQQFKIEVKDQGPGIPSDLMEHLFKPYQRGRDKNTQQAKGIGLGLRFVDVALKRLNSQIHFESSANGSAFYFNLNADV